MDEHFKKCNRVTLECNRVTEVCSKVTEKCNMVTALCKYVDGKNNSGIFFGIILLINGKNNVCAL